MARLRSEALLADGIAAAKAGEAEIARNLLLEFVETDSESEQAWLWLSSVVETDDDRRICLENVLTLNPNSRAAKIGLKKLDTADNEAGRNEQVIVVRREHDPVSLASAVLYPERQTKEWRWHDSVELKRSVETGFATHTGYDDVWESGGDICAYCAQEIHEEEVRCPKCKRKLIESAYRYQRPTAELTIYWVLILGAAQLYFVRILLDLAVYASPLSAVWHAVLFAILVILVVGIFLRRFWAYGASIVVLLLIISGMALVYFTGADVEDVVSQAIGADFWGSLAINPVLVLGSPIFRFIVPMQFIAVLLALLYGLIKIGPDFERVYSRRVAAIDKGLEGASHYYAAGKAYAEQDMWANVILHWRRAVALEPARPFYLRVLGEAYARLGFYERSLDVLESARQFSTSEAQRAGVEVTMEAVRLDSRESSAGGQRDGSQGRNPA